MAAPGPKGKYLFRQPPEVSTAGRAGANAMLSQAGVYQSIGKLDRETQRKMEAAFAGTSQEQRETKQEPAEIAVPELPLVPDGVLDQILANALAQQALNAMLRDNDIEDTIDLLDREAQRKAVAEFVVMARKQQEEKAAAREFEEASDEFPEVSDDLVLFIIGEARLRDQLRDIMRQRGLAGEPTELPFETLRSVVAALMEGSGAAPQAGVQLPGKRPAWWQFWRWN